jgi:Ca-activated chloride channel family protein
MLCCAALVVPLAQAESFNRRLARGQALLKTGDLDEAITIFRDLQVDDPESDMLHFDLGCASYAKALRAAGDEALPDAAEALQQAVKSFEEASTTPDNALRRDAQFNRATALAQLAKQSVAAGDGEATITNFEEAITALEDFLRQYPEHAEAQTNLNNVRYELKKFLQQTPPPNEQQNSEGEEGEKGEQSDQEQDKSEQQQDPNQQQEQGEEQEQEQSSQGDQEQKPQDKQEGSQGESSPEDQQEPQDQQQPGETTPQDEQAESQSQQIAENSENIEAILDSLQDTDQKQQHEMRQQARPTGIRSKWW